MIWGKTAKACDTAGGRDNGVPNDLVGGSVQEPVNLEDTEEHDAPPSPNRQVPPFAGISSQGSKTPPTPRSAACKKPGVDGKHPQKFVFKKFCRGQGEKIRWSSFQRWQTMCACVHFVCLSASEFQGGRQKPRFSQSCARSMSCMWQTGLECYIVTTYAHAKRLFLLISEVYPKPL
jgi:hypothetical protein